MTKLSEKSKTVIERFIVHRDRCRKIEENFGPKVADEYHHEFKGRPGSKEAEVCFKQFMNRLN